MRKMLYKAGGTVSVWGRQMHTLITEGADVEAKVAEGWVTHPRDVPETMTSVSRRTKKTSGSKGARGDHESTD